MMNQGQAQNVTEQMGAADQAAADQQAKQDAAQQEATGGMNQDQAQNAHDQQAADQAAADQQAQQDAAAGGKDQAQDGAAADQAAADQKVCFENHMTNQDDILTTTGCSGC